MEDKKSTRTVTLIVGAIVVSCCCLIVVLLVIFGGLSKISGWLKPGEEATITVLPPLVSPVASEVTPVAVDDVLLLDNPPHVAVFENYDRLMQADLPLNDLAETLLKFDPMQVFSATYVDIYAPYDVGDIKTFYVINGDSSTYEIITATLMHVSDVSYFWVDAALAVDALDVAVANQFFAETIHPTNHAAFGGEWNPGVDGDSRVFILLSGIGESMGGYFGSTDQLPPAVFDYSNGHELLVINADVNDIRSKDMLGILAHEFQHMIAYNNDRNEETWVEEGLSMLAQYLNVQDAYGLDAWFIVDPDRQLNTWEVDINVASNERYGASLLFMAYLWDQFGTDFLHDFSTNLLNGMIGLDAVLADQGIDMTHQEVFTNWTIANYLQDPYLLDGRYGYRKYSPGPQVTAVQNLDGKSGQNLQFQVHQFGADYYTLTEPGEYTLDFLGAPDVDAMPVKAYSGDMAAYSNTGNFLHSSMMQTFDFTNISAPITLKFYAWYDIQEYFDQVVVSASTQNDVFVPLNSTFCEIRYAYTGNVCGIDGTANGWQLLGFDLSQYAGQKVTLSIDYLTDGYIAKKGMMIDDMSIPEAGYFTDFEADDGGWQMDGFFRLANKLPQYFTVSLIYEGLTSTVQTFNLDAGQKLEIPLILGRDYNQVVLVISGTTLFTTQNANYQIIYERK